MAAAWVITTEQSSPLMVAMIQVAAAFPLVALSILTEMCIRDRGMVLFLGSIFSLTMLALADRYTGYHLSLLHISVRVGVQEGARFR